VQDDLPQLPSAKEPHVLVGGRRMTVSFALGTAFPYQMLRLTTFGGCVITRDGTVISSLSSQRRAMVLLAMVAAAGPSGVSRDVIAARLWPDSDDSRARLSLRQLLHVAHTQLAAPELLGSGPDLRLDTARCSSDVIDFRLAMATRRFDHAAELYAGPFLAGFLLSNAPAVGEWIDGERAELARLAQQALEQLAAAATHAGTHLEALAHWRRLVTMDPLSGRIAAGFMGALVNAGDRAAALQHARVYETLVLNELGSAPDAEVRSLTHAIRTAPPVVVDVPLDVPIDQLSSASHGIEHHSPHLEESPTPNTIPARAGHVSTWTRRSPLLLGLLAAVSVLTVARYMYGARETVPVVGADHMTRFDSAGLPRSASTIASVAVLPFVNLSAEVADTHASDGLADELTGMLGRVPGLRVTARTSAFALRDRSLAIRTIAETLGVTSVVEGTWRREGSQLRVTAQLVRGTDQAVQWSGRFDRDARNVLAVQDDLARAIAGALLPHFAAHHRQLMQQATLGTGDEEARDLYLRGRAAFFARPTRDGIEQAREYFEGAIARDSTFARAFAGLSDAWTRLAVFGYVAPTSAYGAAKAAADRALALDSTLSDAHASRGHALYVADFAWDEAERSFRRALALEPNAAFARAPFAIGLASQARFDEALEQLAIARAVDPLSPAVNNVLARVQIQAGHYVDALRTLRDVTTLDPQQDLAWQQLGHVHLLRGEHAMAVAAMRRAAALSGARDSAHLAYALAVVGDSAQARQIVGRLSQVAGSRDALVVHLAMAHTALGNRDQAFALLDRGLALRASFMVGVAVEPAFASLHGDQRWEALLRRMRLNTSAP
jgi:TolB-like protein/DNA-binding SARP family transcriptional activator/Tfp pilus assembly protein PilF